MSKIAVIIEGGLVQGVFSTDHDAEITIIDYDCDGAEPTEVEMVPQDLSQESQPAYVERGTAYPWEQLGDKVRGFVDEVEAT